jgi:hypothetical protein
VSTTKLGGMVLLSRESIEDAGPWSPQSETARIVQDSFSADLDDGLTNGNGTAPAPQGVLGVATASTGTTLVAAVADAMADIGEPEVTPPMSRSPRPCSPSPAPRWQPTGTR